MILASAIVTIGQKDSCEPIKIALASSDAPTYTFAEIRKQPKCFDNAFIEVIGILRTAFENSDFYDPVDHSARAWFTYGPFYSAVKRCSTSQDLKALDREAGGTWGLKALGIVKTNGNFGHMNGWDFEFQAICIENVTPLSPRGYVFASQPEKTQKKIVDWYKNEIRKLY